MSQDTDDMYDDLFKKYGKVVYRSKDQKPPTADVDDDAECLACEPFILHTLNSWAIMHHVSLLILFYIILVIL